MRPRGCRRESAREVRVEVVSAANPRVWRQGSRRQIVRHPGEGPAPAAEHLHLALPGRIPCRADAWRPFIAERDVRHRAGEMLMLVAKTGIERQVRSDLPRILDEQRLVVLRGVGDVAGVCPIYVVSP